MGNKTLSIPSISVNNIPVPVVPNSVEITMGSGEINVRSASTGAGTAQSVHSEDAEGEIGKIKFSMYPIDTNIKKIQKWKENTGANFIGIAQPGVRSISLNNLSLINDPNIEATADGKIEFEFEGDPGTQT